MQSAPPDQLTTMFEECGFAHYALMDEELTLDKALNGPEQVSWKQAIEKELKGLEEKGAFAAEPCPEGKTSLETRYVLTKKVNPDGTLKRYKARLVVKGYRQKYGIDYTDTLSPVIKFDNLRAILALAAASGWNIYALDFTQAYLNASVTEMLWVTLPDGQIVRLQKALYGLKQAGYEWEKTYSNHVLQREFWKRSQYDECIFFAVSPTSNKIAIVWSYVDDCGLSGNWEDEIM